MAKISETLTLAAEILERNGIAQPRREANSLLGFALGKDRTFLIAHSEDELTAEENAHFQSILARRANREPFQYITGRQEFYGLDFKVSPAVLIPRPETELLVEKAIEVLKNLENPRFCEIGAGSGCLSVAILYELKNASAVALDISAEALSIAAENAVNNGVSGRLKLEKSDVFAALSNEKFNLIVSNPPYISAREMLTLQREVGEYEPRHALTDETDGFSIIEKIINNAPRFLESAGVLLLEIGCGQAERVERMFDKKIWDDLRVSPDLQNIPRTVSAKIKL